MQVSPTKIGIKGTKKEQIKFGEIDEKSIESTGTNSCKAKGEGDQEFWSFEISAENLRSWKKLAHREQQTNFGDAFFNRKK